jgi:superfamily II DNA or RNA helicase
MLTLREYQAEGLEAIRALIARGVKRVLRQLPTGGGKTVEFCTMVRGAAAKGKRCLVVVHRLELLEQTCAKLEELARWSGDLNIRYGVICAGFTPRRFEPIQVATIQTLVHRLADYDFDLIILDECHHAPSATYMRALAAYPRAKVVGVTATPCRMDGKGLADLFDELVLGPSVAELTEGGHLAPADVYAPSVIDTKGVTVERGDFVKSELSEAVDRPTITGDAIQHYRRYADGLPAIAFCVSVAHAEHVAAQFRAAGYQALRVDGKSPKDFRRGAIAALARGELDVLTSCEIISEGVDVPVVGCGIMLRPTKSLGLALQQMGRILRPHPGKGRAIILDHAGNVHRHGLPDQPREWSLEEGAAHRERAAEQAMALRQCAACFHVHRPAPVCPRCGYVYPAEAREVPHVEGELVRVERDHAAVAKKREVSLARSLEALQAIERARGYRPGWARHVWAARGRKGVVANG